MVEVSRDSLKGQQGLNRETLQYLKSYLRRKVQQSHGGRDGSINGLNPWRMNLVALRNGKLEMRRVPICVPPSPRRNVYVCETRQERTRIEDIPSLVWGNEPLTRDLPLPLSDGQTHTRMQPHA